MYARLAGLALITLVVMGASLLVGGVTLAPADVWQAIAHPQAPGEVATIVWQLRMPRVCIAAVVGATLAIAGMLLQGMLRNPLADPYLTGVSSGAAAAIALSVLAGISLTLAPALGFIAGLVTAIVVAALARRGSGIDPNRLILAGVSLSALFGAIVALALTRTQSIDAAQAILQWLAGSIAGHGWHDLVAVLPYIALGLLLALLTVPALNALRAGETRARTVGLDVARVQWVILSSAALLAASSVALAGTVGFVGLIVPHLARRLVGSDARVLFPAVLLCGATLCMLADAACRSIVAPAELPIGVLLAFIGVPVFLSIYLRAEQMQ